MKVSAKSGKKRVRGRVSYDSGYQYLHLCNDNFTSVCTLYDNPGTVSVFCMSGNSPENLTYAQYARQGFFELCGVAALNVCLLLFMNGCSRTIRRENHRLRILNIVFSLLTLLLLVTAMSRMGMYIYVYGFTVKRILTSIFMIWLFLVFSMVIVLQKKDIPVVGWGSVFRGGTVCCSVCIAVKPAIVKDFLEKIKKRIP